VYPGAGPKGRTLVWLQLVIYRVRHVMATSVRAEFLVLGIFDSDLVANRLRLEGATSWRRDECRGRTSIPHGRDGICVSSGDRENIGLESVVIEVLQRVEPRMGAIRALSADVDVSLAIGCCVYIESGEVPEVNFSSDTLSRIALLGAGLDIDVIVGGGE